MSVSGSGPTQRAALILLVAGVLLSGPPAAAVIRYIAFGDSITDGIGDPKGTGYPSRLRRILEKGQTEDIQMVKSGFPGEDTSEALTRIDSVLAGGGDVFLLMEGTNDVKHIDQGILSMETVIANLDTMALAAKRRGMEVVHATVIPRGSKALRDRDNFLTKVLVGEIRELASSRKRRLVDVFHAFDPELVDDLFDLYYWAVPDPVGHPNEEGYKRIARTFADVLLENDTTPPVPGAFFPGTRPGEVPPDIEFRVPLYEPVGASGIDQKETALLINGRPVGEAVGNRRRLELTFSDQEAIGCKVVLAYRTQDRANPPNVSERVLDIYGVTDRTLLTGDVDFDCSVNGIDLVTFAHAFGAETADERYQKRFDLNADGVIDGGDLSMMAKNFGRSSL